VSAGGFHTCALDANSTMWCWGQNTYGQLGTGVQGPSQATPVNTGQVFVSITSGFLHTCADSAGTGVDCWGDNGYGELGIDSTGAVYPSPRSVGPFTMVSAGGYHTCAIDANFAAWCWGDNTYGALGTGSIGGTSIVPAPVSGGNNFQSIAVGFEHTCGLTSGGAAYCWGFDSAGALGNGQATGSTGTPTPVVGGLTFASIAPSVAGYHTCGLTTTGVAYCWGYDAYGQLGINSTQNTSTPVQVTGQPAAPGVFPVAGARVVRRPTPKVTSKVRPRARK